MVMNDLASRTLSPEVFARLQRVATPLVDDTNSIVDKLIAHWEANPPPGITGSPSPGMPSSAPLPAAVVAQPRWRSKQGDELPIGTTLRARYCGKTFSATVEKLGIRLFDGRLFESLSAAGFAAKKTLKKSDEAAQTNGRTFWELQDPTSERWVTVKALRPEPRIDSDALLAELDKA
jgi:hypothetical protein